MRTRSWLPAGGSMLSLLLAGCGGGGGGGVGTITAPPAATTPAPTAPTPTPTPTAVNYDTAEYRATVGAVSMNALVAYASNATGAGINLAIIDSGIDVQSKEFGSRISSASQNVAGNGSIDDQDGHGTAVAFTAAGRRNGAGTQGVAFDANLIVLRADQPGSCTTGGQAGSDTGCKFDTDAITRGIDAARTAGARVINLSLGGAAMPQNLVNAIGRATAQGIIVVIAAGNDGTDNPDPFTAVAGDPAARNLVIVAGSVGTDGGLSSFSDRAGTGAAHYLAAVGERVLAPDQNDTSHFWSGTSFAAPQVSGAVALLAQAFPNLSGAQIVDLLFQTARDTGATGIDTIYGNGVMDLTRAFQPVGTSMVAGSMRAVSLGSNATLSAPMGDAAVGQLGAVILDHYKRAFAIDLASTIDRAGPQPILTPALEGRQRNVALAVGGTAISLTLAPRASSDRGAGQVGERRLTGSAATPNTRAIAGTVTQRLAGGTQVGFAFSQGTGTLAARLAGQEQSAFLIAGQSGADLVGIARSAGAVRQQVAGIGVTAMIESGDIQLRRNAPLAGMSDYRRFGYDRFGIVADHRWGGLTTLLTLSRLRERDTMLGARFDIGLGAPRANSWFVETDARWHIGGGWALGGSWRRGRTRVILRNGVDGHGALATSAFAADISKNGLFGHDSIGLRIAQPLRVARGGIDYRLPTHWDYATLTVTDWTTQRLNLAPNGRELNVEARYRILIGAGDLQTNLFWRRDPGHFAILSTDVGGALRYAVGF